MADRSLIPGLRNQVIDGGRGQTAAFFPMSKIPFLLSDDDWLELKPEPIDKLAQRRDMTADEAERLDIFRTMDMRQKWVCKRAVVNNNRTVFLALGVLALFLGTTFGQRAINVSWAVWQAVHNNAP